MANLPTPVPIPTPRKQEQLDAWPQLSLLSLLASAFSHLLFPLLQPERALTLLQQPLASAIPLQANFHLSARCYVDDWSANSMNKHTTHAGDAYRHVWRLRLHVLGVSNFGEQSPQLAIDGIIVRKSFMSSFFN